MEVKSNGIKIKCNANVSLLSGVMYWSVPFFSTLTGNLPKITLNPLAI
jgi:hypothetical protein